MLDTLIAWINPPAFVREVFIAMLMAAVAKFLYWRVERHWERFAGFVSNSTKRSRARRDAKVKFYEDNPHLLPLHVARIANYQYMVLFSFIAMFLLLFVNHFVGTGSRVMSAAEISTARGWIGVAILVIGCYGMLLILLMGLAQSITTEIERRAREGAATPN